MCSGSRERSPLSRREFRPLCDCQSSDTWLVLHTGGGECLAGLIPGGRVTMVCRLSASGMPAADDSPQAARALIDIEPRVGLVVVTSRWKCNRFVAELHV